MISINGSSTSNINKSRKILVLFTKKIYFICALAQELPKHITTLLLVAYIINIIGFFLPKLVVE